MALTPVILNPGVGGSQIQTDNIGGNSYEVVKVAFGSEGAATMVDLANPLPVTATLDSTGLASSAKQDTQITALNSIAAEDFATQATLAAVLAKITSDPATQTTLAAILAKIITSPATEAKQDAIAALLTTIAAITQPLTDAQLRASAVPVSFSSDIQIGSVELKNSTTDDRVAVINIAPTIEFGVVTRNIPSGTQPVSGTFFQATQPVSAAALPLPTGAATSANQQNDALTDTQLRATPVPVSGTVTVNEPVSIDDNGGAITVDATDLDIRNLVFATDKVDASGSTGVGVTGTFFQASQPVSAVALPLPLGAATSANQQTDALTDTQLRATPVPVSGTVAVTEPVSVDDNGGSLTVDAVDLDIRNLVFATDKADVSGSTGVGVTGTFFQATQPVSATNLDIRDLTFAADKVDASGTVLGAGANNIGDVDVLTLPSIPAGTNNIGDVDVLSLPALPAGTNNIGDVDVLTLPAIPTGTNTIGSVKLTDGTDVADVLDLTNSNPVAVAIVDGSGDQITSFGGGTQYSDADANADPTGTVAMGTDGANVFAVHTDTSGDLQVDVLTLPAIPAGNNNIGDVDVASIAAGDNNIGNVDVVTLPALVAGSAIIGNVRIDQTTPGTTNAVQANAGTNLNTSALNLEATQADIRTALQIIDDWDETDRAKVNVIAGQAGIAGGTGVDGATVPRVTLATNVGLPAGTNAIGKLAANSGVDIGDVDVLSLPAIPAGANLIGKVGIDQTTDGTTNKVRAAATQKPFIGTPVALAVTALQSMATSTTVGWKSVRTSNLATLASDYEVMLCCPMANTAPGSSKTVQLFVIPWYTSDGGTTWFAASGGTATLPTSADATYTIGLPHNFVILGSLAYTTQNATVQGVYLLSNAVGARMPDGVSFFVLNDSGAATSTGCILDITPINDALV